MSDTPVIVVVTPNTEPDPPTRIVAVQTRARPDPPIQHVVVVQTRTERPRFAQPASARAKGTG